MPDFEINTTKLHPRFGVEVHDLNLQNVTPEREYPALRDLFERHSLILFRGQQLNDEQHNDFAALFGPLEDRRKAAPRRRPPLPKVSNLSGSGTRLLGEDSVEVRDLKANQLWHTDSTFLPIPALANVIAARVVPSTGGETELVSTRAAWHDMPETMKSRVRDAVILHRLSHSRAKVDAELATQDHIVMWGDQQWRAIWPNPVTGEEALYIASHSYGIRGLDENHGQALIDELIGWCTQSRYVYTHRWRVGDVLIWDERATMHRGRPWPYEEERTMASCCVSVQQCDGLKNVQVADVS